MATTASKIRNCTSRYERNDPTQDRKETCKMVDDFERNFITLLKRNPIDRRVDRSLPRPLARRTTRCLEAARRETDFPRTPYDHRRAEENVRQEGVDTSQPDRATLQVTIEPKSKPRPLPPRVENWMGNFVRKSTRKRVQWRSKLYETEPRFGEQPSAGRAEQLMDAGAEDFVRWLNELGAERSSLTKDIVRQLFSTGSGDETSRALNIAPREIRAVPESVATEWDQPQLALENRIAKVLTRDRKRPVKGSAPRTAFGRSLPRNLQSDRWRQEDGAGDAERPDVPEDLMSLKRLFRDIWHLRSVKYLVDYLIERPALPRPGFLLEKGLFQRADTIEPVPFYRKVLPQKAIAESIRK
uniref:Uncharacterized protein n=1 Tax=Anopheles atroparvus TaxID=41427 RepID=A0AAG5D4A0_ANOAO